MRLFIALDVPAELREAIGRTTAPFRSEAPGARWSKPEALHVTLKFLGETAANRLPEIERALQAMGAAQSISLKFRGIGFFPDEERSRVMFCKVEAPKSLHDLVSQVEKALEAIGFAREARPYVPHLTLARLNSARNVEKLISAAAPLTSYDFGAARESEFHLFESVLLPTGSRYRKLASFPLVKDSS
jgi:RNA 2',3'-cyclic 3'-phosphodiesterase